MKLLVFAFSLFLSINSFAANKLELEFRVDSSSTILNSVQVVYQAAVKPNIFHTTCREWVRDADEVFNGHWGKKTKVINTEVNSLGDNIYVVIDKLKDGGGFCKYTPISVNLNFSDFQNKFKDGVTTLWLPRADFDFDHFTDKIKVERLIFTDDQQYNRLEITSNADAINFSSTIDISTSTVNVD